MSVIVALDVGDRRIGLAQANTLARVAHPQRCVQVDGNEIETILTHLEQSEAESLVVGLPRNMDGAETKQTQKVRDFAHELEKRIDIPVFFQDESLTSVEAERRLEDRKKPFTKGDVDKEAAAIILQDYLDEAAR